MAKGNRYKITQRFLRELKPTEKRTEYHDETVTGLILRVSPDLRSKVWYLSYYNHEGARRRFRIGTVESFELDTVKKKARNLLADISRGADPAAEKKAEKIEKEIAKNRTLRNYVEGDYWNNHLKKLRSWKDIKRRIFLFYPDEDMAALTVSMVNKVIADRRKQGVSEHTLVKDQACLMACLNQAVQDEILEENPLKKWKKLTKGIGGNEVIRYLGQKDEVEDYPKGERARFLEAVANMDKRFKHTKYIVLLAYYTGMRRGEILNLQWDEVSLNTKTIHLKSDKTKSKKAHTVYLSDKAVSILKEWKEQQKVKSIKNYVFFNIETKQPFDSIKTAWNALCKRASIQDFRFHDLRHDFATRQIANGKSIYEVSAMLGHSSVKVTERYAHLPKPADLKKVVGGVE